MLNTRRKILGFFVMVLPVSLFRRRTSGQKKEVTVLEINCDFSDGVSPGNFLEVQKKNMNVKFLSQYEDSLRAKGIIIYELFKLEEKKARWALVFSDRKKYEEWEDIRKRFSPFDKTRAELKYSAEVYSMKYDEYKKKLNRKFV